MKKETLIQLSILNLIFLIFISSLLFSFYYGFFVYLLITNTLLIFSIPFFVNLYLRIQHNIDKRHNSIKHSFSKNLNNYFPKIESKTDLISQTSETITVIIPWKDIGINRLENCLKSLRNQSYEDTLYTLLLIDYGSKKENSEKVIRLSKIYGAKYLRVNNVKEWNRSRCVNIGLRNSNSKYVLITDIDIIFQSNYLSECVLQMQKDCLQVIYSEMLDCPKGLIKPSTDIIKEYPLLKNKAIARRTHPMDFRHGSSIIFTLLNNLLAIGGYDEYYKLYGYEDIDLIKRLEKKGLKFVNIFPRSSFLHQWHPEFDGVKKEKSFKKQIEKNKQYFLNNDSIIRNNPSWGLS